MNFQTLKWMIDSLVKSYKCPMCHSHVNEGNIDIIGAAGTTVNIDVSCNTCEKHSMIKIEVMGIDLTKNTLNKDTLAELKSRFKNISWDVEVLSNNPEDAIKDENIVDLNKNLKSQNLSVEDLFKDEK